MERIRAVVERVVYASEKTGFAVLRMRDAQTGDQLTATGPFAGAAPGAEYELEGAFRDTPYGCQFQAQSAVERMPATLKGLENYLGSGLIPGVGKTYAARIVETFGLDTIRVIEEEPDRLLEVEGIGARTREKITAAWQEHREIKNVMIFLQGHGVSPAYAIRIYRTYGNGSVAAVRGNPYRLIEDVWGIGFTLADALARRLGVEELSPERLQAGVLYVLGEMAGQGHCFGRAGDLVGAAAQVLQVDPERVESELWDLARSDRLVCDHEDCFYLPWLHRCETGVRERVEALCAALPPGDAGTAERVAGEAVRTAGVLYNEAQVRAIHRGLTARVLVLTGGPGTGKTTTVMGILRALSLQGRRVLLAAPTGRAAKRLSQATEREAMTIHRLLEYGYPDGFSRGPERPLDCDALILDEASMIDLPLMYHVLGALPPEASLVMVGDADQLPAVGPGNVLRDFIDSGAVEVVSLTEIFRQARESLIVHNAHRIQQGLLPDRQNEKGGDFFFLEEPGNGDLAETVRDLVCRRLPGTYDLDPRADVQVLTPMHRGPLGAENLNRILRASLNPDGETITLGSAEFSRGDRVMQIRNNYEKKVFNGDIGHVTAVDPETRQMLVAFDRTELMYDAGDADELVLAYAITIHKSQGSEYPVVVVPLTSAHHVMLQRNLLYTAVTRATRLLVLAGERRALRRAVQVVPMQRRQTRLAERLRAMAD